MPLDDDGELMARLRNGEDRALDVLMDKWQTRLRGFAYRYLHNQEDACDVAEETFVRVYSHRANFRPGAKFSTWMFSIALNLCRDRDRRRKARPVILLDHDGLTAASDRTPDPDGSSPDADLLRNETAKVVRAAVDALPAPLRMGILLCEYEHLSHAEAGAVAGCSAKAIEVRLYRARQRLRDVLQVHFT